jgi:hypothetical protein
MNTDKELMKLVCASLIHLCFICVNLWRITIR